jgi:hypothetical protein
MLNSEQAGCGIQKLALEDEAGDYANREINYETTSYFTMAATSNN